MCCESQNIELVRLHQRGRPGQETFGPMFGKRFAGDPPRRVVKGQAQATEFKGGMVTYRRLPSGGSTTQAGASRGDRRFVLPRGGATHTDRLQSGFQPEALTLPRGGLAGDPPVKRWNCCSTCRRGDCQPVAAWVYESFAGPWLSGMCFEGLAERSKFSDASASSLSRANARGVWHSASRKVGGTGAKARLSDLRFSSVG